MPKTEQHAYPFNHNLHKAELALTRFFDNALNLDEQITESENLLIAANRIHIYLQDQKNSSPLELTDKSKQG